MENPLSCSQLRPAGEKTWCGCAKLAKMSTVLLHLGCETEEDLASSLGADFHIGENKQVRPYPNHVYDLEHKIFLGVLRIKPKPSCATLRYMHTYPSPSKFLIKYKTTSITTQIQLREKRRFFHRPLTNTLKNASGFELQCGKFLVCKLPAKSEDSNSLCLP